jgi:aminopeptidase N
MGVRVIGWVAAGALIVSSCAWSGNSSGTASALDTTSTTTTTTAPAPSIAPSAGQAAIAQPGTPGLGDELIPGAGNGGYDVSHYTLEFDVTPPSGDLSGTTTIEATATQALSAFNLDLRGFVIGEISVDDSATTFARDGDELTITPAEPIADGAAFTTVVSYQGSPEPVPDPSAPGELGWLEGEAGSFVVAEPTGAKAIFPSNNHPSDKATFDIEVIAPEGMTVAANGTLIDVEPEGDAQRWIFGDDAEMATYLLQVAIGDYRVTETVGPDGVVLRSVTPSRAGGEVDVQDLHLDATAQLRFFAERFGPYPFANYGLLIADSAPEFALETQTLSILPYVWFTLPAGAGPSLSSVTAHEVAHQWFGNSVSLGQWSDMWLNEGFATYAEWMWDDERGAVSLDDSVRSAMTESRRTRQRDGAVTSPAVEDLFSQNQYGGGAVVLEALRRTVGDDQFFQILKEWAARFADKSVTSADFEALAAEISGQDLTAFFDSWLRSSSLPEMPS